MPQTWVVIPLYNEAAVVGDVVRDLRTVLTARAAASGGERSAGVVCVDDGSTDGSAEVAAEAGAVVLRHAVNLGQGASLQTGLTYALRDPDARYFVTYDADGQHQPADAMAMLDVLRAGEVDIVFGSRFLAETTRPGRARRLLLRAAVAYTNLSTHVRLSDAHNGLRALNRTAAEVIDIRQDRMAHASEIVGQVGQARLRWTELPVHVLYTDYSRAKGQPGLNAVNIVVDLLFK